MHGAAGGEEQPVDAQPLALRGRSERLLDARRRLAHQPAHQLAEAARVRAAEVRRRRRVVRGRERQPRRHRQRAGLDHPQPRARRPHGHAAALHLRNRVLRLAQPPVLCQAQRQCGERLVPVTALRDLALRRLEIKAPRVRQRQLASLRCAQRPHVVGFREPGERAPARHKPLGAQSQLPQPRARPGPGTSPGPGAGVVRQHLLGSQPSQAPVQRAGKLRRQHSCNKRAHNVAADVLGCAPGPREPPVRQLHAQDVQLQLGQKVDQRQAFFPDAVLRDCTREPQRHRGVLDHVRRPPVARRLLQEPLGAHGAGDPVRGAEIAG
ncbi:hypothetical protein BX661DRAFT_181138 [Kickxella alabastrina]|uniref:uncharacterized protein n=1 Tax=Kickxella alabastrina TaxID=61397 RepID=UPI00221FCF9D|nr:uncharacterized protein BX661DRAFT_181138 [Kickxella alabastrina]KAI7830127.1 hypothetical protein BX661DRAFT_181138 [Kickxella alabastrina]